MTLKDFWFWILPLKWTIALLSKVEPEKIRIGDGLFDQWKVGEGYMLVKIPTNFK